MNFNDLKLTHKLLKLINCLDKLHKKQAQSSEEERKVVNNVLESTLAVGIAMRADETTKKIMEAFEAVGFTPIRVETRLGPYYFVSFGSGFATSIGGRKYVVTAHHVTKALNKVHERFREIIKEKTGKVETTDVIGAVVYYDKAEKRNKLVHIATTIDRYVIRLGPDGSLVPIWDDDFRGTAGHSSEPSGGLPIGPPPPSVPLPGVLETAQSYRSSGKPSAPGKPSKPVYITTNEDTAKLPTLEILPPGDSRFSVARKPNIYAAGFGTSSYSVIGDSMDNRSIIASAKPGTVVHETPRIDPDESLRAEIEKKAPIFYKIHPKIVDNHNFYLVSSTVVPGDSGGPVFVILRDRNGQLKPYVIGVNSHFASTKYRGIANVRYLKMLSDYVTAVKYNRINKYADDISKILEAIAPGVQRTEHIPAIGELGRFNLVPDPRTQQFLESFKTTGEQAIRTHIGITNKPPTP